MRYGIALAPSLPTFFSILEGHVSTDSIPKLEPRHSTSPPFPSRAIVLIGGLGVSFLLLLAVLVLQLGPAAEEAVAAPPRPLAEAPPPALPAAVPASLRDAFDEPTPAELAALLDAVREAPISSALQPYLTDLVGRMNVEQEPYRARLLAPDPSTAEERAARLHRLFLDAGLAPDLLTLTGHPGPDGIVVERS